MLISAASIDEQRLSSVKNVLSKVCSNPPARDPLSISTGFADDGVVEVTESGDCCSVNPGAILPRSFVCSCSDFSSRVVNMSFSFVTSDFVRVSARAAKGSVAAKASNTAKALKIHWIALRDREEDGFATTNPRIVTVAFHNGCRIAGQPKKRSEDEQRSWTIIIMVMACWSELRAWWSVCGCWTGDELEGCGKQMNGR